MSLETKCFYDFGDFRLDLAEKVLLRGDKFIPVTPKVFETLQVLVENAGHLIEKDELMQKLWQDRFVEESNVTFNIKMLRKALGDDASKPTFIETIPKRGYRFIADVRRGEAAAAADAQREIDSLTDSSSFLPVSASPRLNSVAVLPFINLSAEAENEYFCDGLTEELLNALSKIENLKVAARTSAFSFKGKNTNVSQIGRVLNVKTVLEGSVRRSGNKLRITVQLVNSADGYHLWSERYDREMQDIFDVQDEIALAVVSELRVKLFGAEKAAVLKRYTANAGAYQHYLRGRFFWNKRTPEAFQKAIGHFERAIELDSDYALAYSGLADCYNALGYYEVFSPQELAPKAKAAVSKALELDDLLAESHASSGIYKTFYEFDWTGAADELKRAIELNPNYASAHHWLSTNHALMKRFDEAFREGERALELDPLAPIVNANVARTLYVARRYQEAQELSLKTLEIAPNYFLSLWMLGLTYGQMGRYQEAIKKLQKAVSSGDVPHIRADLGRFLAETGRIGEARSILEDFKKQAAQTYVSPLNPAGIYIGLGESEQALGWLEKAFDDRSIGLMWLASDPVFDSLRADPRFQNILRGIGLPQ